MTLPPAVPPYRSDPAVLARLLGEAHAYIAQLHAEMERRAIEANQLHDENAALKADNARLRGEPGESEAGAGAGDGHQPGGTGSSYGEGGSISRV